MARRYSIKAFKIADVNMKLKFDSEQLTEDGVILTADLFEETTKVLNELLPTLKDQLPEAITETVFTSVSRLLGSDPTNVYANLLGDEYPRTKLVSVEVTDSEGNSIVYEE